jgi:hypothetical protein
MFMWGQPPSAVCRAQLGCFYAFQNLKDPADFIDPIGTEDSQ